MHAMGCSKAAFQRLPLKFSRPPADDTQLISEFRREKNYETKVGLNVRGGGRRVVRQPPRRAFRRSPAAPQCATRATPRRTAGGPIPPV